MKNIFTLILLIGFTSEASFAQNSNENTMTMQKVLIYL